MISYTIESHYVMPSYDLRALPCPVMQSDIWHCDFDISVSFCALKGYLENREKDRIKEADEVKTKPPTDFYVKELLGLINVGWGSSFWSRTAVWLDRMPSVFHTCIRFKLFYSCFFVFQIEMILALWKSFSCCMFWAWHFQKLMKLDYFCPAFKYQGRWNNWSILQHSREHSLSFKLDAVSCRSYGLF